MATRYRSLRSETPYDLQYSKYKLPQDSHCYMKSRYPDQGQADIGFIHKQFLGCET